MTNGHLYALSLLGWFFFLFLYFFFVGLIFWFGQMDSNECIAVAGDVDAEFGVCVCVHCPMYN